MFDSLLIANRGEIARRIIRTARRMGIRTIAVHSDSDTDLPFVREADEAILIGPSPARESYLSPARILAAARRSGAAAIHPGYGFLSENAEFAEAVQDAGLIWVGAPPASIRAMGLKDAAKDLMIAAGVPVTPGYMGADQSDARLSAEAAAIGWPVLIKAVAGGGGKGMRRVDTAADFHDALTSCRREAKSAFGDDRVLIEKYILDPRHIEVQVFADSRGDCVHLFERDCSLQRRHQKVVEEAPAPGMTPETRAAICAAAVRAARAVDYIGAGTIEFIADASSGLRPDRIWFMEMNTRLQVEHPVTEAITGQDLVEWQLRVAAGEPLPCRQDELSITGWAVEARLYAENPAAGYLPSTGRLDHLRLPDGIDGIRVDSGVEQGDEISPHYDPMIAKIIAHGPDRAAALDRLAIACAGIEVWPVRSNAGLLARIACDPQFRTGQVDTGFLERNDATLVPRAPDDTAAALAVAALLPQPASDPWTALPGFRLNADPDPRARIRIAGETLWAVPGGLPRSAVIGGRHILFEKGNAWPVDWPDSATIGSGGKPASGAILSPMPGTVTVVAVAPGQNVTAGTRLLTVEAMKMEHSLHSPFDGVVKEINVAAGDRVSEGQSLALVIAGEG